jgi:hypothetical protein
MRAFLFVSCTLLALPLLAQKRFTPQQLQADLAVLQKAYTSLHPGLYKYADSAAINQYFADCQRELSQPRTLSDTYLSLMRLTARFQCGHSYPNFYNQGDSVKALFERPTSLPVWFRWAEGKLLVTHSIEPNIPVGAVIKTIDNVPVDRMVATMLPLVRADGANDGKRRDLLQVRGQYFEYFDILLPLLFPTAEPTRTVTFQGGANWAKRTQTRTIATVNHADRDRTIRQYHDTPSDPASDSALRFSWVDDRTARLEINTLANWGNKINFGKFYDAAITEFTQRKGQNLIIDLRRCEGGDLWNGKQLVRHLIEKPIVVNEQQDSWAYVSMDSSLSQYIDNEWAYSYRYRLATDFEQLPSGLYRGRKGSGGKRLDPHQNHLTGRVFLLTSATNSSAAWQLATLFREHKLATLVGQTTGGNQKGITAGALFFMKLPNTGIEVDVPLIGIDYAEAARRPNAGISPDVPIEPTLTEVRQGIDAELRATLRLISQ